MGLLEIKVISGQERRTVSDSRSHMSCVFQKLLRKQHTMTLQIG